MDQSAIYQLAYQKADDVLEEVKKVVHGKDAQVEKAFAAIWREVIF